MSVQFPEFGVRHFSAVAAGLIQGDHDPVQNADSTVYHGTNHPVEPGVVGLGEGTDPFTIGATETVEIIAGVGFDIPLVDARIVGYGVTLPCTVSVGDGIAGAMLGT